MASATGNASSSIGARSPAQAGDLGEAAVPVVTISGSIDKTLLEAIVGALSARSGNAYVIAVPGGEDARAEMHGVVAQSTRIPVRGECDKLLPDHIYVVTEDYKTTRPTRPSQVDVQARLLRTERLLNAAMERAGVGLAMLDGDRRYIFANRAYTDLLGLDDVIGQQTGGPPGSLYREQIAPRLDLAYEGKQVTYDLDRLTVNGALRYFTVAYDPLFDADGKVSHVTVVVFDISTPRAAAQRIAESEQHLRLANEAAGIGTFAIDIESGLAQYSEELAVMLGIPGQRLVTIEMAMARVHRDDVARVQRQFMSAQRPGGDGHLRTELRFVRPGGEVRWMTWNGRVEFADTPEGRKATRFIGACADITDRKRVEAELRGSEARYRGVVEGSLQGIIIQQDEHIVYANSAMAKIFGFDRADEMIGQSTFDDFVAPEERAVLRARTDAVYRGETVLPHPGWRGFRKDGSEIWVAAMAHLAEWQGRPAVVSFYLDVTERKLNEQKLNEALRLMKFASVAGRMGGWHFNPRTGRLTYSDEGLDLLGVDKSTWTGTLDEVEAVIHPDDILPRRKAIADAIAARSDVEFEFRNVRKSGDIRWMLVRGHIMPRPDGRFDAIGVILDVTERKLAEERQQILIRELDHRVKNALANMQLVMERSREKSSTVDEYKAALEGRLMSMAKTHSQLSKGGWIGVNLDEIVREALLPYGNGRNTSLEGPTIILKPAASQAVAMTVSELATNAAKYGALSSQEGHVSVRWWMTPSEDSKAPQMLVLDWSETGGPKVELPAPEGYGSSVIRGLIPYELNGSSTSFEISEVGAHCRIKIPAPFLVLAS